MGVIHMFYEDPCCSVRLGMLDNSAHDSDEVIPQQ